MFSPGVTLNGAPTGSLRNPRRRRREDSERPREVPRKRSKISDETFQPLTTPKVNGDSQMNGHVDGGHGGSLFARDFSLAVRDKRQPSSQWRPSTRDENNVLVCIPDSPLPVYANKIQCKTVNYTVRHISTLPDNIRGDRGAQPFRGSILSSNSSSYAVAVTNEQVIVWDYTASVSNPSNRRVTLPLRCKSTEVYPLAAVVASTSSTEIGLIVVYPSAGKIYYWENIDSIQSLSLLQQRKQVVEGTVPGLLTRDAIDQLIDAESAGYLLLFSSGKLAHLTLRDAQGRPQITISALNPGASSGWLGGWTHALGRGWREKISSVRTRPSATKGQVEAIGLNGEGGFKSWEISWAGNSNFIGEHSALEEIRSALIRSHSLTAEGKQDFKTLDFVLLAQGHTNHQGVVALHGTQIMHILVLVGIQTGTATQYALVELVISNDTVRMRRVIPISFEIPNSSIQDVKPRLLLPKPEHTVFVVFNKEVYIVSLEEARESTNSPDEQLLSESFGPERPFEDVIYFREEKGAMIQTATVENLSYQHKHEQASIVLLTRTTGIVRIIATDPTVKLQSPERGRVTAKGKLEQAVFYGTDPENILDFTNVSSTPFSMTEVEKAALELSREIIDTRTRYLPEIAMSMDAHLNVRAKALRDLMKFLKDHYPPLSRRTRWQLFWDGEKVFAARGMWQAYEKELQATAQENVNSSPFLENLMLALREKFKEPLRPDIGQVDAVRQWFTKDVSRLDRLLSNSSYALTEPMQKGVDGMSNFLRWSLECDELWFGAYESVFSFRENSSNLELYGLESENIQNGILHSGYEGLGEFWTSRPGNVNGVRMCARYFRKMALSMMKSAKGGINEERGKQIAVYQPRLVRICCLINTERYRWLLEQDDEEQKASGETVKKDYEVNVAHEEVVGLASIGQADAGLKLAEQLHEIPALVDLLLDELVFYADSFDDPDSTPADRVKAKKRQSSLEDQVQRYFRTFGDEFASALYAAQIRDRHLGDLLTKKYGRSEQLTKFLRSDPVRAKFSWINEIINEKDATQAARELTSASNQEHNVWSKKIELSLAKLALLSEQPNDSTTAMTTRRKSLTLNKRNREMITQNRRDTKILHIQTKLYRHVRPIVLTALDDAGAAETIMTTFGECVKERPQLHELLRRGFEQLLKHQAMEPTTLIDVLTLMDHVHSEDGLDDICGQEFLMALAVLDASDLHESIGQPNGEGDIMARLIWKRLFVFDDWKKINQTTGKSDNQVQKLLMDTALFVTLKEGRTQCKPHLSPLFYTDHRADLSVAIFDSSPAYTIRHPADVIGAGSSPSDIEHRFPETDLRAGFVKANSKDDKTLQENLNAARMDYWFDTVKDLALQKAEEEAEVLAADADHFRQFQEQYEPPEIEPEKPDEPEDDPVVDEEDELVLNGVEEYAEGDTEEDEHLMSGGRGYLGDDGDVEMAE